MVATDAPFARIRSAGVALLAATLGFMASPRGLAPCPACAAEQRGSHDRRPPVGLTPDGAGWRCHRCAAGGDAVTLLALAVTGSPDARGRWGDVLERARQLELIDTPRPVAQASGLRSTDAGGAGSINLSQETPTRVLRRPEACATDRAQTLALWNACSEAPDADALRWFESRRLDYAQAADRRLVRVLPRTARVPDFARGPDGSWTTSGHRLLVPLYDVDGHLASVRARYTGDGEPHPKSLSPAGGQLAGLVMADPLGRLLLTSPGTARELFTRPDLPANRERPSLIVAEGEPAFLTAATAYGDTELAPGVLGIVSGSWTQALADRVPDGVTVIIDTDHDRAGDGYAEAVRSTLAGRCHVRRTGNIG